MPLFLTVLLCIVGFLVGMALLVIPVGAWFNDWRTLKARILLTVACLLGLALLITIGISSLHLSDGSEHCGPGTRYVSSTHLVGKTVISEWECVAA